MVSVVQKSSQVWIDTFKYFAGVPEFLTSDGWIKEEAHHFLRRSSHGTNPLALYSRHFATGNSYSCLAVGGRERGVGVELQTLAGRNWHPSYEHLAPWPSCVSWALDPLGCWGIPTNDLMVGGVVSEGHWLAETTETRWGIVSTVSPLPTRVAHFLTQSMYPRRILICFCWQSPKDSRNCWLIRQTCRSWSMVTKIYSTILDNTLSSDGFWWCGSFLWAPICAAQKQLSYCTSEWWFLR